MSTILAHLAIGAIVFVAGYAAGLRTAGHCPEPVTPPLDPDLLAAMALGAAVDAAEAAGNARLAACLRSLESAEMMGWTPMAAQILGELAESREASNG